MLRTTQFTQPFATRATFAIAAAAGLLFMTACELKKDETGGRPVETPVPAVTVAKVEPTVGTKTVDKPVVSTTPTDVSFKDAEGAFRDKHYVEASKMFGDYVANHPDNAYGHYMLGLSSWKSGDLTTAEGAFEKSLTLDKKNVKTLLNLSRVQLELDRPKDARQNVTAALKLDSTSNEVHRLMGRVHSTLKENDEAIVSFRLALKYNPSDVWSMNNMALIMIQQGRYDEALGPLARAVTLDSSTPVFHNNLGIVLEHKGQYSLATLSYNKALGADSGYTKAVMSLARIKGLKDDPKLVPLDLAKIGEEFDRDVRTSPVSVAVVKKAPVQDK
jgi:Tfp pilus assembly protein PilF